MKRWTVMSRLRGDKMRQIVCTTGGVMLVGLLLCMAILFPRYYCLFHDKSTLGQTVLADLKINTYETAYSSFAEKLHALAKAKSLRAVRMSDPETKLNQMELTKIAGEELTKFRKIGIFTKKFTLKQDKLTFCERYTIYETSTKTSEEDSFQGISCWKLIYQLKKRTVTLILDEEYHKIYYLEIVDSSMAKTSASIASGYAVDEDKAVDEWQWWDQMIRYYDLNSYGEVSGQWLDMGGACGTILFGDKDDRLLVYRMEYALYKSDSDSGLTVGIPLEKMMQF